MRFYFASPVNKLQCEAVRDQNVLLSFALLEKQRTVRPYIPTFRRLLFDSGAYSQLTDQPYGKVDLGAYGDFLAEYEGQADAAAGLDDIQGDWRQSMRNYEALPATFPTFHDTDPPELLDELIAMSRERGTWLGLGLLPPRQGKGAWVQAALERIPEDIHIHGWALRAYAHFRRFDSMDSTNWWRDAMGLQRDFPWLTEGELLELVIKRYQRTGYTRKQDGSDQMLLGVM
jgi:hypothetical protein